MKIDYMAILQRELTIATQAKRDAGIDADEDSHPARIITVGPDGTEELVPIRWKGNGEKRVKMSMLGVVCATTDVQAFILNADVRYLNIETFCSRHNVPLPGRDSMDAFEAGRRRVMGELYNDYMGNMPRDLFHEALFCTAFGPNVNQAMSQTYTVENGEYVFSDTLKGEKPEQIENYMIPKWWEEPFLSRALAMKSAIQKHFNGDL